jgi:hypothetical protein
MGVSGGGGDPRCALVVDVDAVELTRLIVDGSRIFSLLSASAVDAVDGGGQYCCRLWLWLPGSGAVNGASPR